ncbi:acyl--CoA ligase [Streptomyces sp. N2-109]|uniref:Acyl--CoA ligase n=1 Tax=Streptomyces gossypii TaxID=2883101 RepID=A0ABT2K3I2_9ACTN|nr:class I adenylate-forming enzyme family protein [Streptomyces gossypii]MCT2594735.1 acyl--CoA ligase [Streptomyces gossypii]
MIKLDDIRRHAAAGPDRTALVSGRTRLSWADFEDVVERVTAGLAARLPGGRVPRAALLADARWETAVAMAACATLGISCTALDPTPGTDALTRALGQIRPGLLFVAEGQLPLLDACPLPEGPRALRIVLEAGGERPDAPGTVTFAQLRTAEPLRELPQSDSRESHDSHGSHDCLDLALVPGDGTGTGGPRFAVRPLAADPRQLVDLVDEFGFDSDDIHLSAAPPWEPMGLVLTRTLLALGGTAVMAPHDAPEELARIITEEHVTTGAIDPGALTGLLAHPASETLARTARLRALFTLGRHLGRWSVNTAWERLGPVLHLAEATPETGITMVMPPEESLVAPARSGRPTLGSTLVVLGEDDAVLPDGRTGRLAVSGHQVMDNYLDALEGDTPFATVRVDGHLQRFFLTGDLGHRDERGRLVVTGRSTGPVALARDTDADAALFRLESDLLNLPCLRDTAVMRVDVPALGDALIVAFIAVAVGREGSGYTALSAACARRVPSLPAHVIAVDTIPYSPTGRISTTELLDAVVPIITLNHQLEQSMHGELSA